jgi:hypothetical protein
MAESKYGKYIITELKQGARAEVHQQGPNAGKDHTQVLYLDDEVIKGAFYVESVWMWPGQFYPATAEPESHAHDFDEVITFFGTNPDDPNDLCGEIEFWLEDEKHILTKSCMIFVPGGMKHCPLIIRRVDRPIFHFATGHGGYYKQQGDK